MTLNFRDGCRDISKINIKRYFSLLCYRYQLQTPQIKKKNKKLTFNKERIFNPHNNIQKLQKTNAYQIQNMTLNKQQKTQRSSAYSKKNKLTSGRNRLIEKPQYDWLSIRTFLIGSLSRMILHRYNNIYILFLEMDHHFWIIFANILHPNPNH